MATHFGGQKGHWRTRRPRVDGPPRESGPPTASNPAHSTTRPPDAGTARGGRRQPIGKYTIALIAIRARLRRKRQQPRRAAIVSFFA